VLLHLQLAHILVLRPRRTYYKGLLVARYRQEIIHSPHHLGYCISIVRKLAYLTTPFRALVWGASRVVLILNFVHLLVFLTAILYTAACYQSFTLIDESVPKEGEERYDPDAFRETL
jgi:hypothetical protein